MNLNLKNIDFIMRKFCKIMKKQILRAGPTAFYGLKQANLSFILQPKKAPDRNRMLYPVIRLRHYLRPVPECYLDFFFPADGYEVDHAD